jgi:hypothetical protein
MGFEPDPASRGPTESSDRSCLPSWVLDAAREYCRAYGYRERVRITISDPAAPNEATIIIGPIAVPRDVVGTPPDAASSEQSQAETGGRPVVRRSSVAWDFAELFPPSANGDGVQDRGP